MLQISPEQMRTLNEERLCRIIESTLRRSFPDRLAGHEPLRSSVVAHLDLARRYGITEERALVRFSCLMLLLGTERLNQDSAANYFRQGPESPDQKVDLLLNAMATQGMAAT